jgi:hypothetical protein
MPTSAKSGILNLKFWALIEEDLLQSLKKSFCKKTMPKKNKNAKASLSKGFGTP